jgi:hypothetical protein
MAKKGTKSHQSSVSTIAGVGGGGDKAIKSVVTGYKCSSQKIYSSCMKFYLSPCINIQNESHSQNFPISGSLTFVATYLWQQSLVTFTFTAHEEKQNISYNLLRKRWKDQAQLEGYGTYYTPKPSQK